jgi:cyclopropane fatty-acyl-phospholipid synthase-like methyltransferase
MSDLSQLGIARSADWRADPRHLLFVLSRYKFVAKMLAGRERVLEVGCGDAWQAAVVLQTVGTLHGIDIDPLVIDSAKEVAALEPRFTCAVRDFLEPGIGGNYDAVYSLDVLEHIHPDAEHLYMENVRGSLRTDGEAIFGMPSLQSQAYASVKSRAGHINCKDGEALRALMRKYFRHVFMFGMNDEVVHTGFLPMSHYLIALCAGKR